MQQSPLVAPAPNWRPLLRSVAFGAAVLLGIVWVGVLVIAAVTYHLMSGTAHVALTWDLGRWDTWGFSGQEGNHSAAMHISGIWWILLPLIALVTGSVAFRLRERPTERPKRADGEVVP